MLNSAKKFKLDTGKKGISERTLKLLIHMGNGGAIVNQSGRTFIYSAYPKDVFTNPERYNALEDEI